MRIKIRGGTPRHDTPTLCHTCKFATIVRGRRAADEIVRCGVLRDTVTFAVSSCTRFVDHQHPTIFEMEEIAWILRTDARRQRVGFVHAKRLPWEERHAIDED
jgi:hypothetical protein